MPFRRLLLTAGAMLALTEFAPGRKVLRAQTAADPLAPWAAAPAAADPDPRIRALHWAVLAPNPHNRQPWLLELVGDDRALLFCDLARRLPVTDPLDRQITIGLGCFTELFVMAAAAAGQGVTVTPFPQGAPDGRLDARPVAAFAFSPAAAPADPLFAQVPARRSAKRPYDMARPVVAQDVAALETAAGSFLRFGATADAARVGAIRELAWRAWMIEGETPAAWGETIDLMRIGPAEVAANPDGVSVWGPAIDEAVAAGLLTRAAFADLTSQATRMTIARYRQMFDATPAFCWLISPGSGKADALRTGRAWVRVNLAATARGLGFHPVSQALQEFPEMAGPFAAMHTLLGAAPGQQVQMLARIGHTPVGAPTPRWPARSRILMR
jgi:hypothetical protein